jgi:hypothetical protein
MEALQQQLLQEAVVKDLSNGLMVVQEVPWVLRILKHVGAETLTTMLLDGPVQ